MKKSAIVFVLCLCLTACGTPASPAVPVDPTSSTTTTTERPESITIGGDTTTVTDDTTATTAEDTTTATMAEDTTTNTVAVTTTTTTTTTKAATTTITKAATTTTTTKPTTTTTPSSPITIITRTTTTKKPTTTTKVTTTTAKPTAEKPDGVHTVMELEVFRLLNEERQSQGLAPLTLNMDAHAAAEVRAQEASIEWSHTRPNGTSCFTVLAEFGITYWTAGENLAAGYQTGAALHNGWKNSPGHYANMMGANFTSVAIAVYVAPNGYPYATELFLG